MFNQFLCIRRLNRLLDEVDTPEHKNLIKEIQLLLLMAEDENVGNNDQPSIETSPIVDDHLPNNEINDAFIESNAIDLAVDGKKFFSSSFPSIEYTHFITQE